MADQERAALCALSARLGSDPLRTQAAGGNTSFKRDGVMWIKASGTWLGEAEQKDIFVPVALAPLLDAIDANDQRAAAATDFVIAARNPLGLRPSVETSVHAVIPFDIVVHIHCVETVAIAVREDAERIFAERLSSMDGVVAAYVPYVKPGLPLALAIRNASSPNSNVLLLGSHGLVVAADTVAEAGALADRISAALAVTARPAASAELDALTALADGSQYRLPEDPLVHAIATDPARLEIARRGTLFPDYVVFLGSGCTVLESGDALSSIGRADRPPLILAVPGQGILLHRDVLRGGDAIARALAEITGRLAADAPIRFLSTGEEDELVNWDAEIYRRSLAGASVG